jgi:hypothetical protein
MKFKEMSESDRENLIPTQATTRALTDRRSSTGRGGGGSGNDDVWERELEDV